jgi:hypothetical protein
MKPMLHEIPAGPAVKRKKGGRETYIHIVHLIDTSDEWFMK